MKVQVKFKDHGCETVEAKSFHIQDDRLIVFDEDGNVVLTAPTFFVIYARKV